MDRSRSERWIWWLAIAGVAAGAALWAGVSLGIVLLAGLLLLCPLAMSGMHGGGHGHAESRGRGTEDGRPRTGEVGGPAPPHRH